MKKGAFFILALLVYSLAGAQQVPQGIKYQAVARDNSGAILANQNINLIVTLVDSAQGGTLRFQENHKVATNQFGLFNITIGNGVNKIYTLSNIPWSTGQIYLIIRMDPTGGNNYEDIGTAELLSVPYAFYAETSGGAGMNDTSSSNESVTNFSFNNNTNQLSMNESGRTFTITINEENDDIS